MWFVAAPIANGNFTPHTPVMWTPPTYDDLMARDAAVAVIVLNCSHLIVTLLLYAARTTYSTYCMPHDTARTSLRCRWQTRATQCLAPIVLYTDVNGRRSPVYHTDHPPIKLTAPYTIDMTTHMIGFHQHLTESRYITTPLSRMVCHPWLALGTVNLHTKFEVSTSMHSLRRYERPYKMSKMEWFWVIRVTPGHWK